MQIFAQILPVCACSLVSESMGDLLGSHSKLQKASAIFPQDLPGDGLQERSVPA